MRWLVLLVVVLPGVSSAEERRGARSDDSGELWMPIARNTVLTLGLSFGQTVVENRRLVPDNEGLHGVNLWVGAAYHPRPASLSPFVAAGLELGSVTPSGGGLRDTGVEFIPSTRLGLAVVGPLEGVTIPLLQVYGIAGYRIVTRHRELAPRVGAGISVPAFAYVQAKIVQSLLGVPVPLLPWMVEVTYDLSSRQEIGLRAGIHI